MYPLFWLQANNVGLLPMQQKSKMLKKQVILKNIQ